MVSISKSFELDEFKRGYFAAIGCLQDRDRGETDCEAFYGTYRHHLEAGNDWGRAGRYFAETRQGSIGWHDWPQLQALRLTEASQSFGAID